MSRPRDQQFVQQEEKEISSKERTIFSETQAGELALLGPVDFMVLHLRCTLVHDSLRHISPEPQGLACETQEVERDGFVLGEGGRREVERKVGDGGELCDPDVVRRRRWRRDQVERLGGR